VQVAVLLGATNGADRYRAELRDEDVKCGCAVFLSPNVVRVLILQGWDFSYISYRAAPALVIGAVAVQLRLCGSYICGFGVVAGRRTAL
jgi:hypothetical protein